MKMTVFWDIASNEMRQQYVRCSEGDWIRRGSRGVWSVYLGTYEGNRVIFDTIWILVFCFPPKRCYPLTKLHDVTTQKTSINISTEVETSDLLRVGYSVRWPTFEPCSSEIQVGRWTVDEGHSYRITVNVLTCGRSTTSCVTVVQYSDGWPWIDSRRITEIRRNS
jgi:hypothetical protein